MAGNSQLRFDLRGNLLPAKKNELTLNEFERFFVSLLPYSSRREELLEQMLVLTEFIKTELDLHFELWIDGSFVSKKREPNDIDLVLLVDYEDFNENRILLEEIFTNRVRLNWKNIDGYLLILYPESHNFHSYKLSDKAYWYNLFTKTKMNRAEKRYDKGFVNIKF